MLPQILYASELQAFMAQDPHTAYSSRSHIQHWCGFQDDSKNKMLTRTLQGTHIMKQLELNFQTPEPFDVRIIDAHDWIILRVIVEADQLRNELYSLGDSWITPDANQAWMYLLERYDLDILYTAIDLIGEE